MTNKQKYPDARIDYNQFVAVGDKIKGRYFIRLEECTYLLYDGTVGGLKSDNLNNTYYKSREEAQQALDKFMNEDNPITLSEIKKQLEEAKKLIGKKIHDSKNNVSFKVNKVDLSLEKCSSNYCDEFFEKNGYVIKLSCVVISVPYTEHIKICGVTVKAHDGLEYEAKNDEKWWKFGCARISKQLIKQAYDLMNTKFSDGNREVKKVTIGACDFDFDTLKQLTEADV